MRDWLGLIERQSKCWTIIWFLCRLIFAITFCFLTGDLSEEYFETQAESSNCNCSKGMAGNSVSETLHYYSLLGVGW